MSLQGRNQGPETRQWRWKPFFILTATLSWVGKPVSQAATLSWLAKPKFRAATLSWLADWPAKKPDSQLAQLPADQPVSIQASETARQTDGQTVKQQYYC